jgi:hypothetical protein
MYRTCLYCAGMLAGNDLVETLPVGRRLAFDSARGRLWVVCLACARWNLVPFDTRLETIDACERLFRLTPRRFSTDNIGLARHRAGVDLIRIGPALRREFAAWRYGERLRRRRHAMGSQADGAGVVRWLLAALGRGPLGSLPLRDVTTGAVRALRRHRQLRDPWTDQLVQVPYVALIHSALTVDGSGAWRLEVPYLTAEDARVGALPTLPSIRDVPSLGLFAGASLFPTLGRVLPALSSARTRIEQVDDAVHYVEMAGEAEALFAYVVGRPLQFATQRTYRLRDIPEDVRLALEMAAHEETEQRVMAGELRLLERQWRQAEAVAAIADRLALGDDPA